MKVVHKLTERSPNDRYTWHILTICKIKVPEYRGSFYWKKVNCKNCLKLHNIKGEGNK